MCVVKKMNTFLYEYATQLRYILSSDSFTLSAKLQVLCCQSSQKQSISVEQHCLCDRLVCVNTIYIKEPRREHTMDTNEPAHCTNETRHALNLHARSRACPYTHHHIGRCAYTYAPHTHSQSMHAHTRTYPRSPCTNSFHFNALGCVSHFLRFTMQYAGCRKGQLEFVYLSQSVDFQPR